MLSRKFWLPYPKFTGNNRYGRCGKRYFKTDLYKDYIAQCRYYFLFSKKNFEQIKKHIKLKLQVFYIPRTEVTKDGDNLLKVLQDVMVFCKIIQDDSQFINTQIIQLPVDRENPRIYVEIEEYRMENSVMIFQQLELTPEEFLRNEQEKNEEDM